MKKIIFLLFIICSSIVSLNAQQTAVNTTPKRIPVQLIDQSQNAVRHWRIYVFETVNPTDLFNLEELNTKFKSVKGFLNIQKGTSDSNRRMILYFDESVDLLKNIQLQQVFAENNLVIINLKK